MLLIIVFVIDTQITNPKRFAKLVKIVTRCDTVIAKITIFLSFGG